MRHSAGVDRIFLGLFCTLAILGVIIYLSASLGLITRGGLSFGAAASKQLGLGLGVGLLALLSTSRISYQNWRSVALPLFVITIVLSMLVLIPSIGMSLNGARRWIPLGSLTFQPSEFLKIGFVMFTAWWMSAEKGRATTLKYGLIPFAVALGVCGILVILEPDMGTAIVFFLTGVAMYFSAGAKKRHMCLIFLAAALAACAYVYVKPHALERVQTYLNPESDPQGASFHVRQALVAIGSGKIFGRGFGQSLQKFSFLPEPTSDSIFAVASEEFGFIGSVLIIILFALFAIRGYMISARAPDEFGRLLAMGITTLIVSQAFVNIAAMLGIIPLTGLPLPLISHGGTAYATVLAEIGILLNISSSRRVIHAV